jgi:hexulose-6-phosphate isomerase
VKAYFDVGNVAISGYPQDWIRVLGKRIVKLHIKDFKFEKNVASWTNLKEGAIDWRAVHAALQSINYKGTATVELPGGDGDYLKEVNRRFEQILSGV